MNFYFQIFLASFYTASVGFQCSYKATTEADHDFKVITRIFNGQAGVENQFTYFRKVFDSKLSKLFGEVILFL
jgi:hypothetical protein